MGYYYCRCFGRNKKHIDNKDLPPLDVVISNKSSSDVKMNEQLERKTNNAPAQAKDNNAVCIDHHANAKTSATTFSYRELATATNNFRQEFLIGEGGFGLVYKGKLERTGQVVAVKQLNHLGSQGDKEFLVEVLMLSLLCHPNLVNLIGYCAEGEQRLLVYELMPSGSLEDHLHDLKPEVQPLDWDSRMKIAAGAAKGLDFLHNGADPPVIYRDLKSANILLDQEFNPKLSDFGLAKFGPDNDKSHVSTRVMGTEGYCAPEYAGTGKLTVKSDIYSFGVVLLELITGKKPLEMTRRIGKHTFVEWARPMLKDDPKRLASVADPLLRGQFPQASLCRAMEVAMMCVREDAQSRPSMKEVVQAMDFLTCQQFDPNANGKDTSPVERRARANFDADNNLNVDNCFEKGLLSKNNKDRQLAVAEAKLWGESCRDKRRQGLQSDTEDLSR